MAKGDVITGEYHYYKASYEVGTTLRIVGARGILALKNSFLIDTVTFVPAGINRGEVTVTLPSGENLNFNDERGVASTQVPQDLILSPGTYKIHYKGNTSTTSGSVVNGTASFHDENYSFYYIIAAVENKKPLKKWSITDVITRTLDLAEPIRKGENPRFRLNTEQAELFDKIPAPEFSFTKQTLRECLQEVGHFIHGEPRLTPKKEFKKIKTERFDGGEVHLSSSPYPYDYTGHYIVYIAGRQYSLDIYSEADGASDNYFLEIPSMPNFSGELEVYDADNYESGKYFYEVSYDMYASQEQSGIYTIPYISKNVQHVVDSYLSWYVLRFWNYLLKNYRN